MDPTAEPLLVPSADLIARLVDVDAAYTLSRLRMIERRPGNPLGAAYTRIGRVTAFSCRAIRSYSMNRVIGLGPDDADILEGIVSWFDPNAPSPTIELPPTALSEPLTRELRRLGFAQTHAHATVAATAPIAPVTADDDAPDITVEVVTDAAGMAEFEQVYFAGWGRRQARPDDPTDSLGAWLTEPGWVLYLARYRGIPAGAAVLYRGAGIDYLASAATAPEWRSRGVQAALLRRRIADAARDDLVDEAWPAGEPVNAAGDTAPNSAPGRDRTAHSGSSGGPAGTRWVGDQPAGDRDADGRSGTTSPAGNSADDRADRAGNRPPYSGPSGRPADLRAGNRSADGGSAAGMSPAGYQQAAGRRAGNSAAVHWSAGTAPAGHEQTAGGSAAGLRSGDAPTGGGPGGLPSGSGPAGSTPQGGTPQGSGPGGSTSQGGAASGSAGRRVVFSQAEYLSSSYRNMLRAGLPLLYNQSAWTRVDGR